ncbi:MAG: DHH family phosphoesterase [Candidatus Diapherotrites archaeon]
MTCQDDKIKNLELHATIVAEKILHSDDILIIHHYDADGIASAAIMAKALQDANKSFSSKALKQMYKDTAKELAELNKFFVFLDFGSSYIDELKETLGNNFVVIDHHQPKAPKTDNILNCWHFNINGSTDASSSTLTYLVAKKISNVEDSAHLAIIGSLGDIQDIDGSLKGLNNLILKEAENKNLIEVKKDIRLYGRFTRPLVQFIAYSLDPILPGLTGNEENTTHFLIENGFELKRNDHWLCYEDLMLEEKQRLATALIVYLRSNEVPEWKITRLIGNVYTLLKESSGPLRDAKEYATLLNACGRNNFSKIGFEICMGDRGYYYKQALSMLVEHRKNIREGLELMLKEGIQEAKNFYYFNAGKRIKDSIIGIVAGMLYSSNVISPTKPIVAFAETDDGFIKVSVRANYELVKKGLNLGLLMRLCCELLDTKAEGGGHQVAAGAKIPREKLQEFIEILDKKLDEQIFRCLEIQ